tara:strand:+ start:1518 stop:2147 length:630 start_codon:yes stop_codon:yes gene_type:complete
MLDDKKVLFLGDSICRHYFEYTESHLKDNSIEAITPERWVTVQWKQQRTIDTWFANKRRYNDLPGSCMCNAKYVHFNFGLHYIKLPSKGHDPNYQEASDQQIEEFETDLKKHIDLIRDYDREPLFTNTTLSPKNHNLRKNADVIKINEIAKEVTHEKSVPLNDVYKFIENYPEYPKLYMHPNAENNCHFNDTGRKVLGEQIAKFVLNEI